MNKPVEKPILNKVELHIILNKVELLINGKQWFCVDLKDVADPKIEPEKLDIKIVNAPVEKPKKKAGEEVTQPIGTEVKEPQILTPEEEKEEVKANLNRGHIPFTVGQRVYWMDKNSGREFGRTIEQIDVTEKKALLSLLPFQASTTKKEWDSLEELRPCDQ